MTLVELRLNLKTKDLAWQVSRCLTTWICFLYHYIEELYRMASVEQVSETLPCAFKKSSQPLLLLLMAVNFF